MNPLMYNTYTNKEFCRLFLHEATTDLEKALLHRLENIDSGLQQILDNMSESNDAYDDINILWRSI